MPFEIWAFLFMGVAVALVALGIWGMRASFRPVSLYEGRHRGPRRASYLEEWLLHRAIQSDIGRHAEFAAVLATVPAAPEFPELADASHDAPELDVPAQVKGSYAHLRTTDELDSTAERFWRLVDKGIRPPSPWGTPEADDVWDPMPAGVDGYAIAGRTR